MFSFESILNVQVVSRTLQLINQMLHQKQEVFLELLLEIYQAIFQKLSDAIKQPQPSQACYQLIDEVYSGFDTCVKLLAV
jgi:hypothetical protein